ncbi:MarR family winged helix-turn-helix transcriptional regulator [Streptomyces sp. NPDC051098]|uniref:MarR family winged helix-turn-helix transcriptional regulator n=1 Tax=Streptomyces sp. NPDC051098 TaxID=3155411 RepID=UPI0034485D1A
MPAVTSSSRPLCGGGACSQRTLCRRLGVDRTVMTYLLNDLEQAGLVERKADPSDRRSWHIGATGVGRRRWDELRGPVNAAQRQVLELLPEGLRVPFCAMLGTLAGSMDHLDQAECGADAPRPPGGAARAGRRAVDC